MNKVVGERLTHWSSTEYPIRYKWHIFEHQDPQGLWTEVLCGGGINMPGYYSQKPDEEVCSSCLAERDSNGIRK